MHKSFGAVSYCSMGIWGCLGLYVDDAHIYKQNTRCPSQRRTGDSLSESTVDSLYKPSAFLVTVCFLNDCTYTLRIAVRSNSPFKIF